MSNPFVKVILDELVDCGLEIDVFEDVYISFEHKVNPYYLYEIFLDLDFLRIVQRNRTMSNWARLAAEFSYSDPDLIKKFRESLVELCCE